MPPEEIERRIMAEVEERCRTIPASPEANEAAIEGYRRAIREVVNPG